MATTTITDIETPLAEQSDYELLATLFGPDGVTPVEPAAISTLTATLRSLDPAGPVIFADRDVKSSLGAGGALVLVLQAADLIALNARPLQRRMLTLKLTQTNGRRRNQVVTFAIEDFPDV